MMVRATFKDGTETMIGFITTKKELKSALNTIMQKAIRVGEVA